MALKDILIASVDDLKGFSKAINAIFPKTKVQLCIVHQIRNSLHYVASKNKKEFMKDLKLSFEATSKKQLSLHLINLKRSGLQNSDRSFLCYNYADLFYS